MSVGHRWEDIQEYTLSQFRIFCAAAVRHKAIEQASLISSVAIGAQGTSKSIASTVTKITKNANG